MMGYDSFIHCWQAKDMFCVRPFSHALRGVVLATPSPASTERSRKGPFAFLVRTTPVRSGPEWGASQKHRAWNQDQASPSQPRHRDCKKLAVKVTSSTARDVNGPSWELGSIKAEELGRLEKVIDYRSPCCNYV